MRIALIASALVLLISAVAVGQNRAIEPTFVIIVHRENPVTSVSRSFVADALLKRTSRWPNGETIRPVDLGADSPIRRRVSDEILHRTVQAVRSYWQQMIFSGRGVPPVELASDRDVVRYVATHRGAIGYVSSAADISGVKAVTLR